MNTDLFTKKQIDELIENLRKSDKDIKSSKASESSVVKKFSVRAWIVPYRLGAMYNLTFEKKGEKYHLSIDNPFAKIVYGILIILIVIYYLLNSSIALICLFLLILTYCLDYKLEYDIKEQIKQVLKKEALQGGK